MRQIARKENRNHTDYAYVKEKLLCFLHPPRAHTLTHTNTHDLAVHSHVLRICGYAEHNFLTLSSYFHFLRHIKV